MNHHLVARCWRHNSQIEPTDSHLPCIFAHSFTIFFSRKTMCLSTEDIHLIKSAHTCNQACRRSHRRETPNHVRAVRARMRIHCETSDSHEECERDKASDEPFHIGTSMMNIFLAYTLVALQSHVFVIFTHFCRITIPQSDERAHTQAPLHTFNCVAEIAPN